MTNTRHRAPLSDIQLRVKALEAVLTEKGLVDQVTLDTIIDNYENKVGPHLGAQVVARAWTDPDFKARLLADGSATIAEVGMAGIEGTHVVVKENTPEKHNLVVCTLCSCYPWSILGLPPMWYKSTPYRARAVRDPRGLLKEFDLELDDDIEVHVWDSNAEIRYLVLPMRPEGTEGLSVEELAGLVSRDAMIGTAIVSAPD
ncbi:MAG TPA: nitrile hydratase subunit alpha [Gammaproteobacteria bacterium]|nr:nitrile hydratase subunit alpha [Gammaproteobacteria bacterium]